MIHPYPICAIVGEEVLASEPIVSGSTFATHIASETLLMGKGVWP